MYTLLTKETILKIAEIEISKFINNENSKRYILSRINTDDIFQFIREGVTVEKVRKLFNEMQQAQIYTESDVIYYMTLMLQKVVLGAVCETVKRLQNLPDDFGIEEMYNKLIELKTTENTEIFDEVLADTLEDYLKRN